MHMRPLSDEGTPVKQVIQYDTEWHTSSSSDSFSDVSCVTALMLPELVAHQLLQPKSQVLIAMSGGQDSTVLAFALFQIQHQWQLGIQGLYHNHGLQVDNFYMGWHALRYLFYLNWSGFFTLSFHHVISEDESWRWRRQFRARFSTKNHLQNVVLGHTQTDLAESVLLHLIRSALQKRESLLPWSATTVIEIDPEMFSSSVFYTSAVRFNELSVGTQSTHQSVSIKRGAQRQSLPPINVIPTKIPMSSFILVGEQDRQYTTCLAVYRGQVLVDVPWRQVVRSPFYMERPPHMSVIRPLLGVSRLDVHFLCTYWNLPLYSDQTNAKMQNTRAQLRYWIFPMLETLGFSNLTHHLARYMEEQREDDMFFRSLLEKWRGIEDINSFHGLPPAIHKRFVSQQFKLHGSKGSMKCVAWSFSKGNFDRNLGLYWPGRGGFLKLQNFGLTGTRTQN